MRSGSKNGGSDGNVWLRGEVGEGKQKRGVCGSGGGEVVDEE